MPSRREQDLAEVVEQIAAEHVVHRGNFHSLMPVEILTLEERLRREAVARAETNATILSEAALPREDRRALEERLRHEQVEQLKAEMQAGKTRVTFGG